MNSTILQTVSTAYSESSKSLQSKKRVQQLTLGFIFRPSLSAIKLQAAQITQTKLVLHQMGTIFGKIGVETPKFEVLHTSPDYEIRKYSPSIIAQVTYDPAQLRGNRDGGFSVLANYIGALGQPQNKKPEKIAMTAPVITQSPAEKIAMTAPVMTESAEGKERLVTMQFVLPSQYKKIEDAPEPVDERVLIREEGERKYGVVRFNGVATDEVVDAKVNGLRKSLERDGYKVDGQFLLARYNPPWTLPAFRTNEIMIPIE